VSAPVKGKTRSRKPPLRLSAAEVAEIDQLIEDHRSGTDEQREQERLRRIRHDEEVLQRLVLASPKTPWPKQVGPGPTSGRDGFLYVREEEGLQLAHVVEVARRDGVIRYALAPGDPEIDLDRLDRYWRKVDPSFKFILDHLNGVRPDGWDCAIQQAVADLLLGTGMPPLSAATKQFVTDRYVCPPDPKRRERDQDRVRASVISGQVNWLENLLRHAGFTDARTRARAYLAPRWYKVVKEEGGRPRFNSGEALSAWLRRHDPTKSTLKMSRARGRSERSSKR
jgi:hypothetical protein